MTPYPQTKTIAVAPALNFTGSRDFDPIRVGDLMASELSRVAGIEVIGVNRVLAALANRRLGLVTSPGQALEVTDQLGADAILVFAITEYDPYDPPVVGLVAQLYGRRSAGAGLDPVAASRRARPDARELDSEDPFSPWASVQRTLDASDETVADEVEEFAERRDAGGSPYGWRRYLVSQELFLRFCCATAVRELMAQQVEHLARTPAPSRDREQIR